MRKNIRLLAIVPVLALVLLAGAIAPNAEAAAPTMGLVAHWKFEGNASDSAGTNNGTLVNSPVFMAGKVNQALSLNGSNRVALQTIDYGTAHTFAYWLNYQDSGDGVVIGGSAGSVSYASYIDGPG